MFDSRSLTNRWLALQVRPGWELKSADALRRSNYEEFVPLYEQKRVWSDRTKTVKVPLFSGYVFLRFQAENPRPVFSIPGAVRLVGMGTCPIPIENSEIEALRIAGRSGVKWTPHPYLDFGTVVEVRSGPLSGLRGRVVNFKNNSRLIISVDFIKQSASLEISEAELDSALMEAGSYSSIPVQ